MHNKWIKCLHSDRGGEYFSNEFHKFCEKNGIVHQCTTLYTPQQNGLVERKKWTLVDMVNSLILNAKLPLNLWGEALLTSCYILNRIPSRVLSFSPHEKWKGRKPNIEYFTVWGA